MKFTNEPNFKLVLILIHGLHDLHQHSHSSESRILSSDVSVTFVQLLQRKEKNRGVKTEATWLGNEVGSVLRVVNRFLVAKELFPW